MYLVRTANDATESTYLALTDAAVLRLLLETSFVKAIAAGEIFAKAAIVDSLVACLSVRLRSHLSVESLPLEIVKSFSLNVRSSYSFSDGETTVLLTI